MKKLVLVLFAFLFLIANVKADELEGSDFMAFCYGVYERTRNPQEVDKMRSMLNDISSESYQMIVDNPAFEKGKEGYSEDYRAIIVSNFALENVKEENIDKAIQKKCLSTVYPFLAAVQMSLGEDMSKLETDFMYCFGYLESAQSDVGGTIFDYCDAKGTDKQETAVCEKKILDKLREYPSFVKGMEDTATVNPIQYALCMRTVAGNFTLVRSLLADM